MLELVSGSDAPELTQTVQYVEAVHGGLAGLVEVRSFLRGWVQPPSFHATIASAVEAIGLADASGCDVYVGVATRRESGDGTKAGLAAAGALWVDVDYKAEGDLAKLRLAIRSFPFAPSITVQSGHGAHLYWLLIEPAPLDTEANRTRFENILKGLAATLGGDMACTDSSRIMRAPGTINRKAEREEEWVQCGTEACPGHRYSLDAFDAFEFRGRQERGNGVAVEVSTNGRIAKGNRHRTLLSFAGTLRHKGVSPQAMVATLLELNRTGCDPPLPEQQVRRIAQDIGAKPSGVAVEAWPEPRELPPLLPSVPEFAADLLPLPLRAWAVDIAERMQVPLDFIAAPAMVSLASVVGRSVAILPKVADDWTVFINSWGLIVASPGYLKTPAMAEALRPLGALITRAREEFDADASKREARGSVFQARRAALEGEMRKCALKTPDDLAELCREMEALHEEGGDTLAQRRYLTSDPTVEALGELLRDNPNGVLLLRDELSGWLRSLTKTGREGDREFYLETWSGSSSYTADRIKRGSIHIPKLVLSILGSIQPGKLTECVRSTLAGGEGDDGLLQRFQFAVWPDATREWVNVDRAPDHAEQIRVERIFAALDTLDPAAFGAQPLRDGGVPVVRFEASAQDVFDGWRAKLELRLRSGELDSPVFEGHLAKYRSLMPTIALLIELVEFADDRRPAGQGVSVESAERAIRWCDYLEAHARRIYASVLNQDVHRAHALGKRIRSGDVVDLMPLRDIYKRGWSNLDRPADVFGAMAVLTDLGWTRTEEIKTHGRPSDVMRLNPALANGGGS